MAAVRGDGLLPVSRCSGESVDVNPFSMSARAPVAAIAFAPRWQTPAELGTVSTLAEPLGSFTRCSGSLFRYSPCGLASQVGGVWREGARPVLSRGRFVRSVPTGTFALVRGSLTLSFCAMPIAAKDSAVGRLSYKSEL